MGDIRHLYLLRHAKSGWDKPGQADHERPLADRGWQAVKVLAQYVEQQRIAPELILCSSARRTRDTLAGVMPSRAARIESELFVAGPEQLLGRLREVEPQVRSVMVVGHNPALQMLTLSLAAGEAADRPAGAEGLQEIRRKLPTGGLVTLSFDVPWAELGQGSAELVDYARPKALLYEKQP